MTWVVLLGILGVCIALAIAGESKKEEKCIAKGGEWHGQYKSEGLCLPKGAVIPLD